MSPSINHRVRLLSHEEYSSALLRLLLHGPVCTKRGCTSEAVYQIAYDYGFGGRSKVATRCMLACWPHVVQFAERRHVAVPELPKTLPVFELDHDTWTRIGDRLYGPDPRRWRFACPACGHVQSHESAEGHNPGVGDTSNWIYFACEGRHTKGEGCDWTLGGLFQIHQWAVRSQGALHPVFRFADTVPVKMGPSKLPPLPERPRPDEASDR